MRILVTGAAGFIGCHVVRRLSLAGHEILGLDVVEPASADLLHRLRFNAAGFANGGQRYVLGDIRNDVLLVRLLADFRPDAVLHLAALAGVRQSTANPRAYCSVNVEGTASVLCACAKAGIGKLVFASSSSVYGDATGYGLARESDAPGRLLSVYARTKWKAEELLRNSHLAQRSIILRFFSVYGPMGRTDMMPWTFADRLLRRKPVEIHEGTARDFTHVDDVTRAVQAVVESEYSGAVFNVACGQPASPQVFLELLGKALGEQPRMASVLRPPELPLITCGDARALKERYGWSARVTLEKGVAEFGSWFREHGFGPKPEGRGPGDESRHADCQAKAASE